MQISSCVSNTFTVNFLGLGEKLGRRKTIWVAMAVVIVGATLQATAFTIPHLIIGRVITGMGTGIKTSTVPMSVQPSRRY